MTNYATENTTDYNFELECSLLENKYDETFGKLPYFGLKLVKFGSGCYEEARVADISTDKEQVLMLRDSIIKNSVTPTSFYDIIDDWLNNKYSL